MELNLNNWKMIKKVLLITFLFLIAICNLNGQIQKKTLMFGGEFKFPFKSDIEDEFREISLNSYFGYFIVDNLVLGLNLESDFFILDEARRSEIGIGPVVRYYIEDFRIKPFLHVSYLGSFVRFNNTESKEFVSTLRPGIGLGYMIIPSVGVEALLSFNFRHTNNEYADEPSTRFASFRLGFQIFIPPQTND